MELHISYLGGMCSHGSSLLNASALFHCCCRRCNARRLAPLSEGRIDQDGTLMCSYHGWQFNGQGACTRIPQIGDEKAHATACSSNRSCVASYPVKVDRLMSSDLQFPVCIATVGCCFLLCVLQQLQPHHGQQVPFSVNCCYCCCDVMTLGSRWSSVGVA